MARALTLLKNKVRLEELHQNISALGIADAAERVAAEIEKLW
jgi:hypothetical protein